KSVAVAVWLPEVLKVREKLVVPPTSAALAGRAALASELVMPTLSPTLLTRFQLASTALTVRLKALPAVVVAGVPVLPVAVPGAAVSPGARICSLVKAPGLTERDGVVDCWIVG